MIRVALYARYSTAHQNERSIADQIAVLTDAAARRGWIVVASYMDAAISGRAMADRPGLLNAVAAAERGEFDALLVEDEDRIARDEEHLWNVYNRLGAAGAFISTVSAERVSRMQTAFKSFMAAEYVQVLSQKTKRGLASNADKGLSTGGRLYGYRSQPGGEMEILPDQAEVILRIFHDYADRGLTPREIAGALNAEAVPSPTGGQWNASSINGSAQRANGVLHSEIYAGVKVFGRVEKRKDRATGKRLTIIRPVSDHVRTPVPHLAIVPRDLWDRVQARLASRRTSDPVVRARQRRPRSMLSGLLKCGRCGGSFTALNNARLQCSAHRERGPLACDNRRIVMRHIIEARVLNGLREQLLAPELVAAYVRAYHAAWQERAAAQGDARRPVERRLGEVERSIGRLVDALASGSAAASAVGKRLTDLEAEQTRLQAQLAELDQDASPPITLHPRVADAYAARIEALQETMAEHAAGGTAPDRDTIAAVRDLIDRIEIEPVSNKKGAELRITLHGQLETLIAPGDPSKWVNDGAPGRGRTGTPFGTGF